MIQLCDATIMTLVNATPSMKTTKKAKATNECREQRRNSILSIKCKKEFAFTLGIYNILDDVNLMFYIILDAQKSKWPLAPSLWSPTQYES